MVKYISIARWTSSTERSPWCIGLYMLLYFSALEVESWTCSSARTLNDRSVAIGGPKWIPSMLDSGEWYMSLWLGEKPCWRSDCTYLGGSFLFTSNWRLWLSSSKIRVSCWLSLLLVLEYALQLSGGFQSHLFCSSITSCTRLDGLWVTSNVGALSVSNEQVILSLWHRLHGNCRLPSWDDGKHRCFRARH
jgi:hypothetical protein